MERRGVRERHRKNKRENIRREEGIVNGKGEVKENIAWRE